MPPDPAINPLQQVKEQASYHGGTRVATYRVDWEATFCPSLGKYSFSFAATDADFIHSQS
jgi:hypothetical protein